MNSNPIKFNGTAGGYFVAFLVELVMMYIFIIGWPIAFNFVAGWIVENLEVEGKKMKYSAGYGETLGFILINVLLIAITFGIYVFWFVPKTYRYVADHSTYVDAAPVAAAPAAEASAAN